MYIEFIQYTKIS